MVPLVPCRVSWYVPGGVAPPPEFPLPLPYPVARMQVGYGAPGITVAKAAECAREPIDAGGASSCQELASRID